jgi:hypothetical protein
MRASIRAHLLLVSSAAAQASSSPSVSAIIAAPSLLERGSLSPASLKMVQIFYWWAGGPEASPDWLNNAWQVSCSLLPKIMILSVPVLILFNALINATTFRLYRWAQDQSTILAYIDAILFDAIQSSRHTTPTKTGNATLRNYQRYLKTRWRFGEEPEDEAVDDINPESIMDVVREGKDIVLRPVRKKEAETSEESETS